MRCVLTLQCRLWDFCMDFAVNLTMFLGTMVSQITRDVYDDFCINIHINGSKIHNSGYFIGLVNKRNIKSWLNTVCMWQPLYIFYNITVNQSLMILCHIQLQVMKWGEYYPWSKSFSLAAHQQMLLQMAPGEINLGQFNEHM